MPDALGRTHATLKRARKSNLPIDQPHEENGDENLDERIPQRLKILRTRLGISAATLDREAGFSPGTTGRMERGDQRVYAAHLYRISTATGMAIGYFFDPSNANTPHAGTPEELEKQRLLRAYMKITDPGLKRDVFELIETLAGEYTQKNL